MKTRRRTTSEPIDEQETEPTPAPTDVPKRQRKAPAAGTQSGSPSHPSEQSKAPGAEPPVAPPPLFATAPEQVMQIRGMQMPDMQHGFQTIVHDLFESGFDVVTEYREIKSALVITDALTPDRLRRAANQQEDTANRAHQLYIIAKVEVQAYMRETEGIYGAIREAAIQELEKDKANKVRTKQITDADAKSEAARLYPDEWADICTRRDRAEAMLKQLENLAQLARSRCYTVSNMASPGARLS